MPQVPVNHRSKATLSWLAMALLTLGSVGDLGSAPATAVLGLASVVIYVVPAIVFLAAGVARVGRARLGLAGRRLQLGVGGDLSQDGLRRHLVSVRPDDLLLPGGARLRREHAGVRVRAELGAQRPLHERGDHRPVLVGGARQRQRGACRGQTGVVRDIHRNADPGPAARRLGRDLPPPGQRLGGAAERPPRAPAWNGITSIVLIVNSFFTLRRGRGQRRPRRRAARRPARVPQGDPAGRDTDSARLHLPDARDLGRRSVRRTSASPRVSCRPSRACSVTSV